MKLKGLRFIEGDSTPNKWWPQLFRIEATENFYYSEKENLIVLGYRNGSWSKKHGSDVALWRALQHNYPDLRPFTDEERKWLDAQVDKRRQRTEASKEQRKMKKELSGPPTTQEQELVVARFLNGERAQIGGRDASIKDNSLCNYGRIMLHRVAPAEFLLGAELSNTRSNPTSASTRVLSLIVSQRGLTLWPSTLFTISELTLNQDLSFHVLEWCTKKLNGVYLRYPGTKHKGAFDLIVANVRNVFEQAVVRWQCRPFQVAEVERLLEAYGDPDRMKAINAAMYMQYQMTKN